MTAPQPPIYEIRVAGRLSSNWDAWFDGLSVTSDPDGTSVIRGSVVDQAALHGLLQKLRDLGVPLLSLTQDAPGSPGAPGASTPDPSDPTETDGATS